MTSPTLPCHCGSQQIGTKFTATGLFRMCGACGAVGNPGDTEEQATQFWNAMVVRMKEEKRDA